MSITTETVKSHLKDPAIFCCQRKKGLVIGPADLEDPDLFEDMMEAGLLTLSEEGLTIEQVLGAVLITDCDALSPILPTMVDTVKQPVAEEKKKTPEKAEEKSQSKITGEKEDKVLRTLVKRYYKVTDVVTGDITSFENGVVTIDRKLMEEALQADPIVKEIKIDVIKPEERHIHTDTIMDVCPVAAKVEGSLGEGITNVLEGAVFMLTGVDEDGTQVHEFGSSEGFLDERMAFGNPGCADEEDIIIRVEAVVQRLTGMERRGPYAAHKCEDVIIQAVRNVLRKTTDVPVREELCKDVKKYDKPRVVLVKEIMGQGAMHDNILCPTEPCGVPGGQKNVDLGNVPLMLSPNEVRDGGIHALTCIGPATKEMTRHYFREPLVEALAEDKELDLIGVIFVGSPQVNDEKAFVSERLGAWIETMDIEGAVVTTEGFGNNHIDFTSHIEQIGKRDIPVVGVSFCAYQGQLVVGNKYADAMIEINKDKEGFENEIAGCSEICPKDAARAVQMLKNKMMGVEIKPASRKWSQEVIDNNNRLLGL